VPDCTLAEDATGAWKLVFLPDELHLYVGFAPPGAEADPVDGMTIEDFLVRLPSGALHRSAHRKLIGLLGKIGEKVCGSCQID